MQRQQFVNRLVVAFGDFGHTKAQRIRVRLIGLRVGLAERPFFFIPAAKADDLPGASDGLEIRPFFSADLRFLLVQFVIQVQPRCALSYVKPYPSAMAKAPHT